jgi:hypothetical protein
MNNYEQIIETRDGYTVYRVYAGYESRKGVNFFFSPDINRVLGFIDEKLKKVNKNKQYHGNKKYD